MAEPKKLVYNRLVATKGPPGSGTNRKVDRERMHQAADDIARTDAFGLKRDNLRQAFVKDNQLSVDKSEGQLRCGVTRNPGCT